MARRKSTSRSRRSKPGMGGWLIRLAALLVLVGITYSAWFWWDMRDWRPDIAIYPEQGAALESGSAKVRFETVRALGGDFVYLALSPIGGAPDPGFLSRLDAARDAGLKVGVTHTFDPCHRADPQSARFTRMVPRDANLLPPAIAALRTADACDPSVSDAAVESELMTLVNQIEMHSGKPAILKVGPEFEERHGLARSLERDLWLVRDRSRPDYAGRPWLLWTANSQYFSAASEDPIEWVVVQR